MKILLVEDDALIVEPLAKALIDQRYAVDVATDGQAGWELLESFTYDLILLDVMLPKLDGMTLCRRLRSQGNQTPILLLTAQKTSTNTAIGLDAGADDYVAKPFNLQELLARIRALLRRGGAALPPLLEWRNLKLDPSICEVTCNSQSVRLTPKEYSLLELFLRNPHRIYSTSALIDHIWSFEEPPTEDTIRSHIKGLRHKIKAAGGLDDPIETVYGIGYRLRLAEENSKGAKEQKSKDGKRQESKRVEESTVKSQTEAGITNIWEQVKEDTNGRVDVLEQAVALLLQNKLSDEWRQQAEWAAHKLAGSLGMFGADEGSRLAQEIETLLEKGVSLDRDRTQQLSQLVTALRQEVQRMNTGQLPEIISAGEPIDERPWLLIVSPNQLLAEQLAAQTSSWGMRSQITPNPVVAREQITDQRPNAVLLDFSAANTLDNNLTLLAELSACTPPVPALVLTQQDSLIDRVKIARLGGRRVLQQPVTATQVLEAVNQLLQNIRLTKATVMIVDDDPQVLMALQRLLIPWGLYVSVLDNPLLFLDTLEATPPDILVLDVEMPHISGIELCQVVRNEPRWSGLPILFLTAHTDAEIMHRVFAAGADDYVRKPIVGPELVNRIFNRLERSRLLKTLSETDALTGVANRRKSTQELTQFLEWSRHCHQPFCFAIVKLDHLGHITQQYGHAAGDEVLARFGELLRQTFHSEDVVGRWGGAEFVVGMSGMTKEDGVRRLGDLRKMLRQFEFKGENGTSFRATFSVGVVQYPQNGDALQLLYRAASAVLGREDVRGDSV
ncbi:response regulator [Microcoleus sp. FACHB-SPT15]|uniref:response regulator n=1 Tax=Microcoleus sp. FACHB-SPT15 TaxID=2692830 RepID=UPI0017831955|nr:response regulator [Microcoleus sp. FACHB-SPT15]MBD1804667.1 response regulator [Microcoleus sp. FACHB-SPT15]